jgi:GR25 family glycosyltransferase involved in LPS biosynthesis
MFTKILYINLDRLKDRKDHMETELKKINWSGSVERISAVDGKKLLKDDLTNLLDDNAINQFIDTTDRQFAPGSYMLKEAAGCALSHKKCWENILDGSDERVLILEDDIHFDEKFNEKLKNYISNIPDYDILYIGFHKTKGSSQHNNILKKPDNVVFGLFGYIVNKRIAQKLLNMFPIQGQIDSEIEKIYKNIKVFHVNEDLRIIYSNHSFNNTLIEKFNNTLIEKFNNTKYRNRNNNIIYRNNNTKYKKDIFSNLIIYFIIFLVLFIINKMLK